MQKRLAGVVMLGDGNHILDARFAKQPRPCHGIEVLGLEHGDEVFVAEL